MEREPGETLLIRFSHFTFSVRATDLRNERAEQHINLYTYILIVYRCMEIYVPEKFCWQASEHECDVAAAAGSRHVWIFERPS